MPLYSDQTINRVPVSAICELNSLDQHKFVELRMSCLDLEEKSNAEEQANNLKLSLSTTSTEVLLDCQNVAQSEINIMEFNERDNEFGSEEKLETNMDSQICDGSSNKEAAKKCEIQPSDMADVNKEFVMSSSQNLFDNKARECTDQENIKEDDRSQLCESVSEHDCGFLTLESEDFSCENTCVIPTRLPLLKLLLLNTKESSEEGISIKKMLTPVWKMIATHRHAGPFLTPVRENQAPGYKEIVMRPMDLKTIKRRLSRGIIKKKSEFQRDVLLMLQNCIMYNNVQHTIHQRSLEMQKDVVELLQVLNVQVHQRSRSSN